MVLQPDSTVNIFARTWRHIHHHQHHHQQQQELVTEQQAPITLITALVPTASEAPSP